jgi:hypothetical protein
MQWKPISGLTPDVEWAWLKTQEDGEEYTYVGYIHHVYDITLDNGEVSRMISCGEHHFATKRRIRPTHFCPIEPPKNG